MYSGSKNIRKLNYDIRKFSLPVRLILTKVCVHVVHDSCTYKGIFLSTENFFTKLKSSLESFDVSFFLYYSFNAIVFGTFLQQNDNALRAEHFSYENFCSILQYYEVVFEKLCMYFILYCTFIFDQYNTFTFNTLYLL